LKDVQMADRKVHQRAVQRADLLGSLKADQMAAKWGGQWVSWMGVLTAVLKVVA
jgi:hypothetical protein